MIYLHVNKGTVMLSLATSHIAHLCNQLNHVALPIFMPRFKSNIYYYYYYYLFISDTSGKHKQHEARSIANTNTHTHTHTQKKESA